MAGARRGDSDKGDRVRLRGERSRARRIQERRNRGERAKERESEKGWKRGKKRDRKGERKSATKRREEPGVGRASDGRRDGRLDSITWRTILPRRHCLLEHLLRFSWFGTPSTVSRVPLHHDILFACYNTDDDDDDDGNSDGDEDEEQARMRTRMAIARIATRVSRLVDLGFLGVEGPLEPSFRTDKTRVRRTGCARWLFLSSSPSLFSFTDYSPP